MALTKEIINYVESTIKRFITTSMNRVVQEAHTHPNKPLLDTLTSAGTGTLYLADDGLYKPAGGAGVTSVTATTPLASTGGATPDISISQATALTDGYLSSTDWNTFNSKFTLPSLTSGSVLFSNGTTIAQDNTNFFWDNTNKRLGVGAAPDTSTRLDIRSQGALSTDIAFRIRNSANTQDIMNVAGNGDFYFNSMSTTSPIFDFSVLSGGSRVSILRIVSGAYNSVPSRVDFQVPFSAGGVGLNIFNQLTGADQLYLQMNRNNFCLGSNTISNSTSERRVVYINNGVAPTTSVTDGFKLYSADRGGTAGKASPHFRCEDGTIIVLGDFSGFGTSTPQARVDVRAQGALSTDIALRVRNSADSVTLQEYRGDGSWLHRNNANTFYEFFNGTDKIEYRRVGTFEIGTNNDVTSLQLTCNSGNVLLKGGSNIINIINGNNYHFEENTGILNTSGAGCIVMKNRTAPSTNVQDRFYLYAADIVAGNSAPHFRTENGAIIKLYQETTAVGSSTLVGGGGTNITDTDTFDGYTIQQIVKALRTQGLLA